MANARAWAATTFYQLGKTLGGGETGPVVLAKNASSVAVPLLTDASGNLKVVAAATSGGSVSLDAATLAALETIGLDAATLAALETTGLNAGETHIGEVGAKTVVLKPTITVDTGAYAPLDILGALVVSGVVTLTGAVRVSGGTCVLESLTVFDDDNEKSPLTFLFFDAAPASGTYVGNGPLAFSAGDKAKFVGKVDVAAGDYFTVGGEAVACIKGIGLAMQAVGSANLFMIPIVTSGTPTYTASTDIQVALGFLQD